MSQVTLLGRWGRDECQGCEPGQGLAWVEVWQPLLAIFVDLPLPCLSRRQELGRKLLEDIQFEEAHLSLSAVFKGE